MTDPIDKIADEAVRVLDDFDVEDFIDGFEKCTMGEIVAEAYFAGATRAARHAAEAGIREGRREERERVCALIESYRDRIYAHPVFGDNAYSAGQRHAANSFLAALRDEAEEPNDA